MRKTFNSTPYAPEAKLLIKGAKWLGLLGMFQLWAELSLQNEHKIGLIEIELCACSFPNSDILLPFHRSSLQNP
jgi:hypothetical protein